MSTEQMPAAFPTQGRKEQRAVRPPATGTYTHEIPAKDGMTLRDYFAAQAITGVVAEVLSPVQTATIDVMAQNAYAMADAMLRARGH